MVMIAIMTTITITTMITIIIKTWIK